MHGSCSAAPAVVRASPSGSGQRRLRKRRCGWLLSSRRPPDCGASEWPSLAGRTERRTVGARCRRRHRAPAQHHYSQLFVDFGDCDLAAEAVVRGDGFPCTVGGEPAALRLEPVDPSTFTKARWVECVPEPRTPTSSHGLSHLDGDDSCSSSPPSLLDVDTDAE
eukprot:TRINITY_DN1411_c0_g1_i11.p1 TRINITY_DN1411_c0_g1~~TRINITY_DN1411_c0_g1_i11.p1  ORF type:complete len:164 (+),score=30.76 TRINITY_DN1411_c0_g1_i11:20-511(+)